MVFSFDVIIVMMVICYILYAYKAGLHSQLRVFFLYVAPLIVLYFLAKPLTLLLYKLGVANILRNTVFDLISSDYANTLTALALLLALYIGIIFISTKIFRVFISESMKEKVFVKFGRTNKLMSVGLGIFNFYVIIYIIIVPAGIVKIASFDDPITSTLIEYAPPFSRWGRAAASTSDVTESVDSYNTFSGLFSGESLDIYYETVFSYQKDISKKEEKFYEKSFDKLTKESQDLIRLKYKHYYGTDMTDSNYGGFYRVFLNPTAYAEILSNEESAGNSTKALREAYDYVKKYEGLVVWFADENISKLVEDGDTASIVKSYKDNFTSISGNLRDEIAITNVNNLYMAINVYDTFTNYLDDVALEIGYDYPDVDKYDFATQSLAFMNFVSTGNNMSYLIENYNEDYQAPVNDFKMLIDALSDVDELGDSYILLEDALDKSFELSERYVQYYVPIINYLDPDMSALGRITIAAVRTEFDLYKYMSDIPVLAALVNDVSLLCKDQDTIEGVTVCNEGGLYKAANIISSAYIMNAAYDFETKSLTVGYYNATRVRQLTDHIEKGNKKYIYTDEFIMAVANQIAFNQTQYMGNSTTLLDYMIDVEHLFTTDGIQELIDYASNRTDLFSQEFVNKLIAKKEVI